MFDSPSVKALLQQASQIGSFHGMAFMGDLPQHDFNDVLEDVGTRERLKSAFQTAAGEIGSAKAMAKAVKASRAAAEAYLYVRKRLKPIYTCERWAVRKSQRLRIGQDWQFAR